MLIRSDVSLVVQVSSLTPQERLKRKMQAALNKHCKPSLSIQMQLAGNSPHSRLLSYLLQTRRIKEPRRRNCRKWNKKGLIARKKCANWHSVYAASKEQLSPGRSVLNIKHLVRLHRERQRRHAMRGGDSDSSSRSTYSRSRSRTPCWSRRWGLIKRRSSTWSRGGRGIDEFFAWKKKQKNKKQTKQMK